MQHSQQQIVDKLSSARPESDGSIIADCPVCALEGKGAGKLKIFADGSLVCYRFAGVGLDESKKHRQSIFAALGLDEPAPCFISQPMFDGKLTLNVSKAERGRQLVVARNCGAELARDVFDINKMADRNRFVGVLNMFTEDERREVGNMLVQIAGRYERAQAAVEDDTEEKGESVIFKDLPDGRLIEQIAGGQFMVYDPQTATATPANSVECDGVVYVPVTDDPTVADNELHLAYQLTEYHKEKYLDEEIEDYLAHFCDAPALELRFAAKLVRLSYIQDRLNEVPYLHAFGQPGSGKTRFSDVVGMACYRPLMLVSGSAASTFRICESYMPTLCFDEFNPQLKSDDTEALIQILNAGFQRRRKVPRAEKGPNGAFITKFYRPFGIKIFSGLKLTGSFPFESRTIPILLSTTRRKDIGFCDTGEIDTLSAPIREKLTLWRLRNWHRDYQIKIRETELIFKQREILPRYIQIGVPLGMLIDDADTKDKFIASLEARTKDANQEQAESIDGQIVAAIHQLLTVTIQGEVELMPEDGKAPVFGEPCGLLSLPLLLDACAESLPEKVQQQKDRGQVIWLGRQVKNLGLHTQKILRRESREYEKRAVVLDTEILKKLFSQYSLSIPPEFNVSNVSKDDNSSINQEVKPADIEMEKGNIGKSNVSSLNIDESTVSETADIADIAFQENLENDFANVVALDCETQEFDKKRGITPRNAKLLGLSLCYDGKRADYETNQDAWPLLMPEPEQTVVFHNSKFDLSVLERSGLPQPPSWEDTLIAAHLLDENGEHGLKELAKSCLGEKDVLTFKQATGSPLFDPDRFQEYARNDSRYTFRLWQQFKPRLDAEDLTRVYDLEKAIVPVVMDMERVGMRVDAMLIAEIKPEVTAEIERIEAEIFDYAGDRFDLKSPAKVAAILYDKLGVPSNKQTKGGQRSVDIEALEEVRGYHPVVDAILRYREVDKLASAFIKVLPKYMDERGRIHPEFKALGTVTGRFSCSNPNVQQMPSKSALGKRVRQAFIPDDGNVLVVADYSQMELRVLAHYSRDPMLVQAYTSETETDLHTLTASRMFKRAIEDVSKNERTVAKIINFGIAYGITPLGLFNKVRPEGHNVTLADCEKFIDDYFNAYIGVRQLLEKVETTIKQRGYVRDWYGRRRRVDGKDRRQIRQAQNFIIQATAADIAKDAMVRLDRQLLEGSHLIAQVHDEFIVECKKEAAYYIRDLMVGVMTEAPEGFSIPLKVDAHIVNNWGEAK